MAIDNKHIHMKNETDALSERIRGLEEKRAKELKLLRAQLNTTQESLKPSNLIKSTLKDITTSSELKSNILGNIIGLGTAIISKKLFIGGSHNSLKNIFGTLLQFAVGNVVSKRAKGIKSKVKAFIYFYLKRRKETKDELIANKKFTELNGLNYQKKTFKN